VSAQELTYPQKSCFSANVAQAADEPSGLGLLAAKSLILFRRTRCREIEQRRRMYRESRTWVRMAQLAHKVIHKICGQSQKRFSIIDLGALPPVNPSFVAQLKLLAP
jgi:hypothetical protein